MHMINQGTEDPHSSRISYFYIRKIRPKHGLRSGMGFGLGEYQAWGRINIIPTTSLHPINPNTPSIISR